ncbi:MAG: MFS transporter [Thiohalocapsa sp.]
MSDGLAVRPAPPGNPTGNPRPLYVVGLFAMGYADFYIFLIPLFCLSLGMSVGEIGLIVGARSALAVFLSIHVGNLMDRFGTRRVTLFFVSVGIFLAPVFPLLPSFWPVLVLQIVTGGALTFAWAGSQTLNAQLAEGDAGAIGRFTFFARIGSTAAPIVAGAMWDFGGVWAAFLLGAAWGLALTLPLLRCPEAELVTPSGRSPRFVLRDALPKLSDYVGSFALLALPAVLATIAIMFLRTSTNGVQYSLYAVYLKSIGLTGTALGILFAAAEAASAVGSLLAGSAARLGDPQRTMLSGTVLSILLICVTPFLGGIFALLLLAQLGRGWLQGVVQPLMFSVQAKAVGRYRQGAVVGLRQTMNRLAQIVIPPVMGLIADWWSLTASFVVFGAFLTLASIPIVGLTRRAAAVESPPTSSSPGVSLHPRPAPRRVAHGCLGQAKSVKPGHDKRSR